MRNFFRTRRIATVNTPRLQVFVSYARSDRAFVSTLVGHLTNRNMRFWLDTSEILPSDKWWDAITEAMSRSSVVLALVSARSLASETCRKELELANANGKKIVPVLIEDVSLAQAPGGVQERQCVAWDQSRPVEANVDRVESAIFVDLDWHVMRTSLDSQTAFWIANEKTTDVLLRGRMLVEAEAWLDAAYRDKEKLITSDHRRFVLASRKAVARGNVLPILQAAIFAIGGSFLAGTLGSSLRTMEAPQGIVSLELAGSAARAIQIRDGWAALGLVSQARSLLALDFVYIYFYVSLLFFSLRYFKQYFARARPRWSQVGAALLVVAAAGGMLDVVENILLLRILSGESADVSVISSAVSTLKFAIVGSASLFIVVSLLYTAAFRKRIESIAAG